MPDTLPYALSGAVAYVSSHTSTKCRKPAKTFHLKGFSAWMRVRATPHFPRYYGPVYGNCVRGRSPCVTPTGCGCDAAMCACNAIGGFREIPETPNPNRFAVGG